VKPLRAVQAGTLTRHALLPSAFISARNVDVWCPPGYADAPEQRYPVLYMHDGQNLFSAEHAFAGVDWGIVPAMLRVMQEQQHPGAIVVGIWNSPTRRRDYMPEKPLRSAAALAVAARFADENGGEPQSDNYLQFLVSELKPFIDAQYRTLPDQQNTFVMGSSMGGLVSLYALVEYPEVFSRAGCLSTHWPIGEQALIDYFGAKLPAPGQHRIYFDYGTATLDASYEPFQLLMDMQMRAAGYVAEKDWITRTFVGATHSEVDWRKRVHIPLGFLLSHI
jgi:predicted alpha/beta superfamily hydrolase